MVLGFMIALPLFGINAMELFNALSLTDNSENINVFKYFQSVSQIGLFIFPAIVFAALVSKNIKEYLQVKGNIKFLSLVISCLIMVAAIPLINWLAEMNSRMQLPGFLAGLENWMKESEDSAAKVTEAFLNVSSVSGLLANLIVIAVLAAIGEEFLFRGVLQKLFYEWSKNIHIAIFLSAFLFGVFHLQFYGLIPRVLMGALFGYLLYWSGSIWLPILAHFMNNAVAVIVDFLSRKKHFTIDIDTIGTEENALLLVSISLIMVLGMAFLFYKKEKKKDITISNEKL